MFTNKLKKIIFKKDTKSNRGFGILQVLAGMSFMFILIYGIMTMLENTAREQKKQTILANLRELQVRIAFLLSNQDSWRNTLMLGVHSTAATMQCLQTGAVCSATARNILQINDGQGNTVVSNLPEWGSPTYPSGGFTFEGAACSNFYGTAGNGKDDCPFSYKIIWEPLAAGADPGIRITARLIFNPSPTFTAKMPIQLGKMNNDTANDVRLITTDDPTKKAVNPPSGVVADPKREIFDSTIGKYDVLLWRTATTNILSFRVVSTASGICPAAFTARTSLNSIYDPFGLITTTGGTDIIFKKMGTYDCDVAVNGNGVRSFQAKLFNTSAAAVGAGASFAPFGSQATLEFNSGFTLLTEPNTFQILQACEVPNGSTNSQDYGSSYGSPVTASLNCRVID